MRIAIVNWSSRKAGGAETYLDNVAGGLRSAGHEIALFCEVGVPENRAPIHVPRESPIWEVSTLGLEPAINALREWRPDVIYGHGLDDPHIEARTLQIAPAVFFAHGYYGVCISGAKTFKFPLVRPCNRQFGWRCLTHFYPHRCGGLSPLTMWGDFGRQSRRLRMLRSYRAIVTASRHMRLEYLRHGFAPDAVKVIPLPADGSDRAGTCGQPTPTRALNTRPDEVQPYRLLFVARMELLKGGGVLLDALPCVVGSLERSLTIAFVGDGQLRSDWEERASLLQLLEPRLRLRFSGWLEHSELDRMFDESDLLVVPSLWPEPFGLIGPEAGLHSLPAVGFRVGGISEWLIDGVNGYLAPGDPPTAAGLAQAIVKCLRDSAHHAQLRQGAFEAARQFSLRDHVRHLGKLFDRILGVCLHSSTEDHRPVAISIN